MIRLCIFLAALLPLTGQAGGHQSLDSIAAAAVAAVESRLADEDLERQVLAGRLDRRLKLAACDRELSAVITGDGQLKQRVSVGVRCEGSSPWSLYVPVTIKRFDRVLVSRRALSRGSRLTAEDFVLRRMDISRLGQGYMRDPARAEGMIVKRPLRTGSIIKGFHLKAPNAIVKGEKVHIRAQSGHFEIRMQGEALENGALGQLISVKNLSSRRTVQGVVAKPGLVEVRL